MAIRVVARERLVPGKKEEAIGIFRELIEHTRKEEGCVSYHLNESLEDPDVVAMIEVWETEEALDRHLQSEHFLRLIPRIGPLTAEPSRLETYKEIL